MQNGLTASPLAFALLCLTLVGATALLYGLSALGGPATPPYAALRGTAQLSVAALVLTAALTQLWSSILVLVVMYGAAVFTAARRSGATRSAVWLALAIGAGAAAVLPAMLISGVVPLQGVAIVPIGGIMLGGAMTATSLAAKRGLDAIELRNGEVEAGLSLGLRRRDAAMLVLESAARDALMPGLDQTRTVGLVTLPGAFIGVLLASGSAVQAGAVQILVLISLLLTQSVAVTVAVELVARGVVHRADGDSAGRALISHRWIRSAASQRADRGR